jgi:hypothetical protein
MRWKFAAKVFAHTAAYDSAVRDWMQRVSFRRGVMRVAVIGSGGREHALAWKLAQSPLCEALWAESPVADAEEGLHSLPPLQGPGELAVFAFAKGSIWWSSAPKRLWRRMGRCLAGARRDGFWPHAARRPFGELQVGRQGIHAPLWHSHGRLYAVYIHG